MGGACQVTVELKPVRLGYLSCQRTRGSEAAQPDRDRATEPGIGGRAYPQGQLGLAPGRVWPACEPVDLGAGQPGRYLVLRLAGLVRRGGCLVEVLPDSGLAPPGPDHAEPDQRAEPVRGGWA